MVQWHLFLIIPSIWLLLAFVYFLAGRVDRRVSEGMRAKTPLQKNNKIGEKTCLSGYGGMCPALRSSLCSDGRCRHHCHLYCNCEATRKLPTSDVIKTYSKAN